MATRANTTDRRSSPRSSGCGSATPSAVRCDSPRTATSRGRSSGPAPRPGPDGLSRPGSPRTPRSPTPAPPRPGWPARRSTWRSVWCAAVDPGALRAELDAALPPGLDVLEVVEARRCGPGRPDRRQPVADRAARRGVRRARGRVAAGHGRGDRAGAADDRSRACARSTSRPALVAARSPTPDRSGPGHRVEPSCGKVTPTVRPEDVLVAPAGDRPTWSRRIRPASIRLAQGTLTADGLVGDPFAVDRAAMEAASA